MSYVLRARIDKWWYVGPSDDGRSVRWSDHREEARVNELYLELAAAIRPAFNTADEARAAATMATGLVRWVWDEVQPLQAIGVALNGARRGIHQIVVREPYVRFRGHTATSGRDWIEKPGRASEYRTEAQARAAWRLAVKRASRTERDALRVLGIRVTPVDLAAEMLSRPGQGVG